jgi:hypothetical protein
LQATIALLLLLLVVLATAAVLLLSCCCLAAAPVHSGDRNVACLIHDNGICTAKDIKAVKTTVVCTDGCQDAPNYTCFEGNTITVNITAMVEVRVMRCPVATRAWIVLLSMHHVLVALGGRHSGPQAPGGAASALEGGRA